MPSRRLIPAIVDPEHLVCCSVWTVRPFPLNLLYACDVIMRLGMYLWKTTRILWTMRARFDRQLRTRIYVLPVGSDRTFCIAETHSFHGHTKYNPRQRQSFEGTAFRRRRLVWAESSSVLCWMRFPMSWIWVALLPTA
jgi:hypothetical protein